MAAGRPGDRSDLTVPVFPLPDAVFFPETLLPLHVFEPRYRRLATDCLAGEGRLVVVKLRPGWERDYEGRPPIHEVAGLGEILQAEALPDGRFNLLLYGVARVRIEGEVERPDLPYRLARVRRLADAGPASPDRLSEGLAALRQAHLRLLQALGQGQPDVVGRLTVAGVGPGAAVDRIVSAVVPDAALRQRTLETLDVEQRLDLATGALSDLLAFVGNSAGDDEESDD